MNELNSVLKKYISDPHIGHTLKMSEIWQEDKTLYSKTKSLVQGFWTFLEIQKIIRPCRLRKSVCQVLDKQLV